MAADRKPGWTRYWCLCCRRALSADTRHSDTVTPRIGSEFWVHDQCGGQVALSSREVAA